MAWRLEHEDTIPMLTDGRYALMLDPEDLKSLRETNTIGDLQRLLLELAGSQRDPRKGRKELIQALTSLGAASDALEEIQAALAKRDTVCASSG